jgi:hypothetical protein
VRKLKSFLVNSCLIGAEGRFICVGQCMKRASCICGRWRVSDKKRAVDPMVPKATAKVEVIILTVSNMD